MGSFDIQGKGGHLWRRFLKWLTGQECRPLPDFTIVQPLMAFMLGWFCRFPPDRFWASVGVVLYDLGFIALNKHWYIELLCLKYN